MTRCIGLIKRVSVAAICLVAYVVVNPTQALCQDATNDSGEEATAPQKQPAAVKTSAEAKLIEYNKKKYEEFKRMEMKGSALIGFGSLLAVTGVLGTIIFGAMVSQIGMGGGFLLISALAGIGGVSMIVAGASALGDARYGMNKAEQKKFIPELENFRTGALDRQPLARKIGISMAFSF